MAGLFVDDPWVAIALTAVAAVAVLTAVCGILLRRRRSRVFQSQFDRLARLRFQERDKQFRARLLKVKDEHNARGILMSSLTVRAMHVEVERELQESAAECVDTAMAVMKGGLDALVLPPRSVVLRVCANALSVRRLRLDSTLKGQSAPILPGSPLAAPFRALDDSFVELQQANAHVTLRSKYDELSWWRLKGLLMLGRSLSVAK